jgi:hypothetical protein
MPTKPTGFTRRQLREIELNARVKRREREEAGYRENRLALVVSLAIVLLLLLAWALTPPGKDDLPRWAVVVPCSTIFLWYGLYSLLYQLRAKRWRATTCTIQFNDIESRHTRYLTTWHPVASYVYEVDGRQYTNDRIRIVGRDFTRASAEAYASKYVPGATRRCFYNPANPQEAVLTRGMRWDIPILFIGVGVGLPILFYS